MLAHIASYKITHRHCAAFILQLMILITLLLIISMFSLICTWTNGWVNTRNVSDLRRHRADYDVTECFYPQPRYRHYEWCLTTLFVRKVLLIYIGNTYLYGRQLTIYISESIHTWVGNLPMINLVILYLVILPVKLQIDTSLWRQKW